MIQTFYYCYTTALPVPVLLPPRLQSLPALQTPLPLDLVLKKKDEDVTVEIVGAYD